MAKYEEIQRSNEGGTDGQLTRPLCRMISHFAAAAGVIGAARFHTHQEAARFFATQHKSSTCCHPGKRWNAVCHKVTRRHEGIGVPSFNRITWQRSERSTMQTFLWEVYLKQSRVFHVYFVNHRFCEMIACQPCSIVQHCIEILRRFQGPTNAKGFSSKLAIAAGEAAAEVQAKVSFLEMHLEAG